MHLFLIHWCPLGGTNQQNPRVCRRQCSIHKFLPCWIYHYTANGSLHIHWCLHGRTTQQNTRVCRTHPSIHQFLLRYIYHCSAKGPSLLLGGTRSIITSALYLPLLSKRAIITSLRHQAPAVELVGVVEYTKACACESTVEMIFKLASYNISAFKAQKHIVRISEKLVERIFKLAFYNISAYEAQKHIVRVSEKLVEMIFKLASTNISAFEAQKHIVRVSEKQYLSFRPQMVGEQVGR